MKSRIVTFVSALFVTVAASLVTAPAQTGTARVGGIVKDVSGARIPNAQVLLVKGGAVEAVRTDATGDFEFAGIPDGSYTLKVLVPGFRALEVSDVVAKSGTPSFLNLTAELGTITERLIVTGQGQPRQQPPIPSTALQQARAIPFSSVSSQAPQPAGEPQRVRVGGNVRPAKLLNSASPEYPAHLAAQGVEGTVILNAIIGVDGKVVHVMAKNSQVAPELLEAAIASVRKWQYEPTLLNGQPVEVITTVTVDFILKP